MHGICDNDGEIQGPITDTPVTPTTSRERSLAQLTPPWKPGESGNPKGRPKKGLAISDMLEVACRAPADEMQQLAYRTMFPGVDVITNRHVIIGKAVTDAKEGDSTAREFVADRTDGKVTQKVLTGAIDLEEQVAVLREMADAEEHLYITQAEQKPE